MTRERLGTISLSNCSRFDTSSGPRKVVPVTLPPGRARLEASSSSTGSAMPMPTIGIDEVAFLAARTAGVAKATIASTRCPTSSCASSLSLFTSPSANLRSNAMFCPSTNPSARIAGMNASIVFKLASDLSPRPSESMPIRATFVACWACAASGQPAAAPPRNVMNSRRLIASPTLGTGYRSGSNEGR